MSGSTGAGRGQIERAVALLRSGYKPVPVLRHDAPETVERGGRVIRQSPGKQPHGLLWSQKDRRVYGATAAVIRGWRQLDDIADYPSIGIACGHVAGADIDIYDAELADRLEELAIQQLGMTPLRRVGQPPKRMRLYRVAGEPLRKVQTPELLKGDLKAKVEVLGQGQQLVAFGTHPVTSMPYAWSDGTPETVPLAELPAVTQEQVQDFVAKAEQLLRAAGYRTRAEIEAEPAARPNAAGKSGNGVDGDPFKVVNDAAMQQLEAWVPALFPNAKRQAATGAWRVSSRDLGRDLEEDLSIAPSGIVDFGLHDMGDARMGKRTPIDLVIEHGGAADPKQAAMWLAARLGITLSFSSRRDGFEDNGHAPEPENGARDRREEVRLAEDRINAIARQCAGMLADELFMRGPLPLVLVRIEEATGAQAADDDEVEPGFVVEGVRHASGSLVFVEPAAERIQFRLDDKVRFRRFDARSQEWVPKSCPTALARRIIGAAAELGFRPCAGIVTLPLFIKGRIIAERGYHARTGLILDYQNDLPPIADKPTRQQVRRAAIVMLRPFRGYLVGLPCEQRRKLRASILAAVLTAVLRPSLPAAPAILFDANQPGAGKGKMARAVATISTGRYPAIITEGHSEEETEKRLAAAILSGASSLLLDNLQRTLASSTLESGLTEGVASIRAFGKLTNITVPCSALVLFTANNAALRADMLRRTLQVRIVVDTENPELRRFEFDPYDEAKQHRPAIVAAALTVARAWWQARDTDEGRRIRLTTLGSFEAWAELVAGAVEFLTGINPVSLIEERKAEDPRRGDERSLVAAMYAEFGDSEWKAGDAAQKLAPQAWGGTVRFKGEKPTGREIGGWLRSHRDRVLGSYALRCRTDTSENVTLWRVEHLDRRDIRDIPGHIPFAVREPSETCSDSLNKGVGACPAMSRMSRHAPDSPKRYDGCSDQPDDEPVWSEL